MGWSRSQATVSTSGNIRPGLFHRVDCGHFFFLENKQKMVLSPWSWHSRSNVVSLDKGKQLWRLMCMLHVLKNPGYYECWQLGGQITKLSHINYKAFNSVLQSYLTMGWCRKLLPHSLAFFSVSSSLLYLLKQTYFTEFKVISYNQKLSSNRLWCQSPQMSYRDMNATLRAYKINSFSTELEQLATLCWGTYSRWDWSTNRFVPVQWLT